MAAADILDLAIVDIVQKKVTIFSESFFLFLSREARRLQIPRMSKYNNIYRNRKRRM